MISFLSSWQANPSEATGVLEKLRIRPFENLGQGEDVEFSLLNLKKTGKLPGKAMWWGGVPYFAFSWSFPLSRKITLQKQQKTKTTSQESKLAEPPAGEPCRDDAFELLKGERIWFLG